MNQGGSLLHLPGVDFEDARSRLIDDEELLLSLLREFVDHACALESSLIFDGSPQSLEDASFKLHQVRGGAANLAARRIERSASQLEVEVKRERALTHQSDEKKARSTLKLEQSRHELRKNLAELKESLRGVRSSIPPIEDRPSFKVPGSSRAMLTRIRTSRILLIDDSDAMRSHLAATLSKGIVNVEILSAKDGLTGFRTLIEQKPDLAICDLQMPDFDGMKLLALRATRTDLHEIPIIMLTAEHDVERKIAVLSSGAADYITKPFHGGELIARAKIHLRLSHLTDELHRLSEELRRTSDELQRTRVLLETSNRSSSSPTS